MVIECHISGTEEVQFDVLVHIERESRKPHSSKREDVMNAFSWDARATL
jgi:hypothetical protein